MARLFTSGFELNSITDGVEFDTISGAGVSIQSTTKRSGGYALKITHSSSGNFLVRHEYATSTSSGVYYFTTWFSLEESVASAANIFGWINPGATTRYGVMIGTDDKLYLQTGTSYGQSSAVSKNTWHRLDLSFDADTKVITAKLDGTQFATYTTATAYNVGCVECMLGTSGATGIIYFDDVIVNDNSGSYQNGEPPDCHVIVLGPNAAGDNYAWLKTDASAGSNTNYQLVDEVPPNDATDFAESKTLNDQDFHNFADSGLDDGATINVVTVSCRHKGFASGNSSYKTQIKKASGGTVFQGGAVTPNSTTWRTNANAVPRSPQITLYQDPDGSAWTKSSVDSLQAGYIISTAGTNYAQISSIWVTVDYIPTVLRSLTANVPGSSTTPDPASTSERSLVGAIPGASLTPNASATIARKLISAPAGASATSGINATSARSIIAALTGASGTPNVTASLTRTLSAWVPGASATPDITVTISGLLQLFAGIAGQSSTPGIGVTIARTIAANAIAQSLTPDPTVTLARSVIASLTGGSSTPDIAATSARSIIAALTGASSTPDINAAITRALTAAIPGASATPNISVTISGLIQLLAAIAGTSATSVLSATTGRALSAALRGASLTPDITVTISGLLQLLAGIAGQSATPGMEATLARSIIASITGASAAPELTASLERIITITASIAAVSATPVLEALIERLLLASPQGMSLTPDTVRAALSAIREIAALGARSVTPVREHHPAGSGPHAESITPVRIAAVISAKNHRSATPVRACRDKGGQ